mmetsp:Transcript_38087/g.105970  ORF Transcript_38087/g.105970 Transcript_38087/m.105970 type:complete len:208 (-) Transcript_38087:44-667(-)
MLHAEPCVAQVFHLELTHGHRVLRCEVGQRELVQEGRVAGIPALLHPDPPASRGVVHAPGGLVPEVLAHEGLGGLSLLPAVRVGPHEEQALPHARRVGGQPSALRAQEPGLGLGVTRRHGHLDASAVPAEAPPMESAHELPVLVHPALCQRSQPMWADAPGAAPALIPAAAAPHDQAPAEELDWFGSIAAERCKGRHGVPLPRPIIP